jgi:photosynthetic reaction center H subunit
MGHAAITGYIDVAQLVLYLFWIFFAGLIYYLLRENHREGYPLENGGRGIIEGWPPVPSPKVFRLANGEEVHVPDGKVSPQTLNARATSAHGGAPIEPIGNPLLAGVGPGAWADRADTPDTDFHGKPKIVPLRNFPEYGVSDKDPDPRGMDVTGTDGVVAGVVTDLWLDTSDALFRYFEVAVPTAGGTRNILLPFNFARVARDGSVKVHALYAHQFAEVPGMKSVDVVTSLEEEKIQAYFGAGMLYADASRTEPLV